MCFYAIEKLGAIAVLVNFNLKPVEIRKYIENGDITVMCIGGLSYEAEREYLSSRLLSGGNCLKDIFFFEDISAEELVKAGDGLSEDFLPQSADEL